MRIFVAPSALRAGERAITGDEHHYLARVRRARAGDIIELVDGEGRRASAAIVRITDRETIANVDTPEEIVARPPHVVVLLPLIKGDRMDFALEKLVEVGADTIIVWPAARSVVKLDSKRDARIAKYAAACTAAARQSGRAAIPTVTWADSLAAACAETIPALRLALDPASDTPIAAALPLDAVPPHVAFASGPEGGLAAPERELLSANGFTAVGLGPRVLRAETAPVAAVSIIRALTQS